MDPQAEYTARRDRFRSEEILFEKSFVRIGNWRLVLGIAAAVLAWFVFATKAITPWSMLIPLAAFVGLVIRHQQVTRQRARATRAADYYQRGLLRLQDKWVGNGLTGERHRNPAHPYADDLDVFGKGSLFELLAITRTTPGEDLLASWLLRPASRAEVFERQQAVAELRPNLGLREDIALLSEDVRPDIEVKALGAWGTAPVTKFPAFLRPLSFVLALTGLAGIVGVFGHFLPLWPLLMVLLCDFSLIFALRSKVNHVLENVESSGRDIKIFSALTGYIERQNFSSPRLSELVAALQTSGPPASRRIFQLGRLVDWLDSSDHMLIRILRSLVLWREQLAISFENWRRGSGQYIGSWVDAVAEFEALSSLAALAYERPDWTAPALLESPVAQFEALEMRHPLLPAADCVPNDLTLDDTQRLLIVSGSNMSGKSTLLRAVGLNCVLAWAGAPVAAGSLSLSCLQIGASIRINDSLQDHRSRFYAEISRIRQIVDLTKEGRAVLFLIDELLSGTNSHDRRIGAAAIVRELMHSNAIGLITTHDLALAHIEQDLTAAIANVHFEDQMNGTQMLFDYKLKPGVVTRSNAIELMRA
ncbi:MAG TPA: hypothetical protein VHZ55_23065, partial [Bryobacteraceae bacterium]|nr:hypothetical protein [Bryobacteraceae bacterium]